MNLCGVGLVVLAAGAATGHAQAGIHGIVTDSVTSAPLEGARVIALDAADTPAASAISDARGRFRLERLPGGWYAVLVTRIGYAPRRVEGVTLASDGVAELALALGPRAVTLDPQVVSASRSPEAALDAPASVSVVDRLAIEAQPAGSSVDHLRDLPGLDVAAKGLSQRTFAARGPSAVNSAALLVLSDYRLASIPSLRLNVPYLIPTADLDLDRIEVARGPGSALYGPDADRGIVHFFTRPPFASIGTAVSLTGGGRTLFHGAARHASRLGDRAAFKVFGEYVRGDDWTFTDSTEQARRALALSQGARADTLRIGRRDPRFERAAGEARLDWLPDDRSLVVLAGGVAQALNAVDLTEVGAVQVRGWRYSYLQARVSRGALFANVFINTNDAGSTYQLRTGERVVEESRLVSAQLQQSLALGGTRRLTVGADLQRIVPRTGGTIHGANEDDDNITQLGVYARSTIPLARSLTLDLAARGDHHDRLDDFVGSPRAALVYRPDSVRAVRLTLNRATSTPVANDLFLDLDLGPLDPALPYRVRAAGTIHGYRFRQDCGGLCMRSPFAPGVALPLDATLLWDAVVQIVDGPLASVPPPTAAEVGTVLATLDLDAGRFEPVSASTVTDIAAARRSIVTTAELGYRGAVGWRLTVSLDVYHTRISNVGNPLTVQTPNAFLNPVDLSAYLETQGFSPPEAAALAGAASQIPLGIVSPEEARNPTDVLLIGRQGGRADFWGVDLGVELPLSRGLSLSGAYSWTSKHHIPSPGGFADIVFNAPKHKGTLGIVFRDEAAGVQAELRGRAVASFPVRSGVYRGEVDGYAVVDASVEYRLARAPHLMMGLAGYNLMNHRHREFVGAPRLGRLVVTRVRFDF